MTLITKKEITMKLKNQIIKCYQSVVCLLTVFTVCLSSCEKTDELTTPKLDSPLLILLSGTSFAADAPVAVQGTFYQLDKAGILDHTVGIDSIPMANLVVTVFVNHTTEVGSMTTDSNGKATFTASWEMIGLSNPKTNNQVRLEFASELNGVPFRKYHTITVK